MWIYQGNTIETIEHMPINSYGFVYLITHIPTKKRYIGKKVIMFNRTLKPLKGTRKKRKTVKESDWKTYYGSNDEVKKLLVEGKESDFKREILEFAPTKTKLTYLETKYQFAHSVIEGDGYFNNTILGKFYKGRI